ncbi:MAG: SDR family NAD(P)-dependent oxidoreductase [Halieaceae bacterium]|jgi:NAD(P)-dependent dehydrogenase (short-subunit alcohol dehydrogenase family)|nr:SDR family NAD(P)-dependent oxidoreductase [Halieaceae bacterium]
MSTAPYPSEHPTPSQLLADKSVLVTGAGMGIGRAIAEACAREGAKVLVADFNKAAGAETVAAIEAAGGEAMFSAADVSGEDAVAAMVEQAVDGFGQLDLACNSAALSRGHGPIHRFEKDVFDQTLAMCLANTWLCMKYELEHMLARGSGAIVNISSNASLRGQAHNAAYASAKGGVNILTKSTAAEVAAQGVRVNAVSPGTIRTPGVERHFEEHPAQKDMLLQSMPMARLGEPGEIAEAVVFLLSDRASYITGQVLSVDGGGAVR